jgi:hypothetical protein
MIMLAILWCPFQNNEVRRVKAGWISGGETVRVTVFDGFAEVQFVRLGDEAHLAADRRARWMAGPPRGDRARLNPLPGRCSELDFRRENRNA